jgi:hypothetical protein
MAIAEVSGSDVPGFVGDPSLPTDQPGDSAQQGDGVVCEIQGDPEDAIDGNRITDAYDGINGSGPDGPPSDGAQWRQLLLWVKILAVYPY